MENRGYKGWGIKKLDNRPVKVLMSDCEDPQLAAKCYNMFIGGYSEEEVAEYFEVSVKEVERAIQHTRSCLAGRTILSHNNDRLRILVQRSESEKYRRLLSDSLSIGAQDYLKAGIAPSGTLREFRQAVGMEEKPGGLSISFNKTTGIQIASDANGTRIRSQEDMIRAIIAADPSCGLTPVDGDAHEVVEPVAEPEREKHSAEDSAVEEDCGPNDPIGPE